MSFSKNSKSMKILCMLIMYSFKMYGQCLSTLLVILSEEIKINICPSSMLMILNRSRPYLANHLLSVLSIMKYVFRKMFYYLFDTSVYFSGFKQLSFYFLIGRFLRLCSINECVKCVVKFLFSSTYYLLN